MVQAQLDAGIQVITDGEYRRAFWHIDFLENLMASKVITLNMVINLMVWKPNLTILAAAVKYLGIQTTHLSNISKKLKDIVGDRGVVKYTIPSPNQLMYPIQWDTGVLCDTCRICQDVQQAYKDAIKAFYDAGCRYLQLMMYIGESLCNIT